jgi:hypothetical protein
VAFPRGWPRRAPELVSRIASEDQDVIHFPSIQPPDSYDVTNLLTQVDFAAGSALPGAISEKRVRSSI